MLFAPACYYGSLALFDHLVGAQQDRAGKRDPERLGGLEIDDELEFGWLLCKRILRVADSCMDLC